MVGLHPVNTACKGPRLLRIEQALRNQNPTCTRPPRPSKGQAIQRHAREEIGLMSPVLASPISRPCKTGPWAPRRPHSCFILELFSVTSSLPVEQQLAGRLSEQKINKHFCVLPPRQYSPGNPEDVSTEYLLDVLVLVASLHQPDREQGPVRPGQAVPSRRCCRAGQGTARP